MKYLLDTHVILWALLNDGRITNELKEKLLDKDNQVFYSTVSMWEVELKHQKRNNFTLTGNQFAFLCDQNELINIQIKNSHVNRLKEVVTVENTIEHKDPFDKMLLAQAIQEDMVFVTHDRKFKGYDYKNIYMI